MAQGNSHPQKLQSFRRPLQKTQGRQDAHSQTDSQIITRTNTQQKRELSTSPRTSMHDPGRETIQKQARNMHPPRLHVHETDNQGTLLPKQLVSHHHFLRKIPPDSNTKARTRSSST